MTTRTICDFCQRELAPNEKPEQIQVSHHPQNMPATLDACPDCVPAFEEMLQRFQQNRKETWTEYRSHLKQQQTPFKRAAEAAVK